MFLNILLKCIFMKNKNNPMKKIAILFILLISFSRIGFTQQINGEILSDTANITILKIWGTHEERGFAYGYFLGEQITNVVEDYILPLFGPYLDDVRNIIIDGNDLVIDSIFHVEAEQIIAGMDSAGTNTANIDKVDMLMFNSFLDIAKLLGFSDFELPGCSSLMSWGDATSGTDLNGKSVISRHLDWSPASALTSNQVMIVSLPSEEDEQAWLQIGFAGHMSALSGINESGLSVYQHVLSDFSGSAVQNMGYEPIWFTMRKILENSDFNNDGTNNCQDMHDGINANTNGYASGYIVTSLASSTENSDSLIALVAELAPQTPYNTFRSNSYPDIIPSDNLYAANYEIKRNNHQHYCTRYYAISYAIGDGLNISSTENWNLMKNYSNGATGNIQFMQTIPEEQILKLAVYRNGTPAYLNNPVIYDLEYLFSPVIGISEQYSDNFSVKLYPNPANSIINIELKKVISNNAGYIIYDLAGRQIKEGHLSGFSTNTISINDLSRGMYILKLVNGNNSYVRKFVKK